MFWIYLGLHNAPLYLMHTPHIILFLTPLSYFIHPTCLLRAPPTCDSPAPSYLCLFVFGPVVVFTLCTPTNHSCTPYFCFPLLFIYIFYLFKKNIFENYKNKNIEKNKKKSSLSFLFCLFGRSRRMTLSSK